MRTLPKIAEARRLPRLPRATTRLSNGLKVVVIERPGVHIVDLQLVVMRGAEMDAPSRAGRVSMTAEMLDEGTGTRSALEIAEQLDYLGAHLDVQAGWDSITVSLHVLAPRLEAALEIFADVVTNAVFPEQEFRRKREERLGALQQEADEAALVAGKALARGIFGPEHPYGAPMLGTCQTIQELGSADVTRIYRETFSAENAFVLVVGDVPAGRMVDMLEQYLGRLPAVTGTPAVTLPVVARAERRILLVDKPGAAQAELRVGHGAPDRSTPDFFPLVVLNTMLGGAFTSRLNMILRERMGVTYGVRSRFAFRRNGGLFSVGAAVFTEAAARSAEVVIEEMQRIATEPVPEDELRRAQNYIALGLPREFETTEDIAAHVREEMLFGLPESYWQEYVDRVFAVTAADVNAAAAQHLHTDAAVIVVVADANDVEQSLRRTKLANVVTVDVKS